LIDEIRQAGDELLEKIAAHSGVLEHEKRSAACRRVPESSRLRAVRETG